jgi:hypothetical protein
LSVSFILVSIWAQTCEFKDVAYDFVDDETSLVGTSTNLRGFGPTQKLPFTDSPSFCAGCFLKSMFGFSPPYDWLEVLRYRRP